MTPKERKAFNYMNFVKTIKESFLFEKQYRERVQIKGKDYKKVLLGYRFIDPSADDLPDELLGNISTISTISTTPTILTTDLNL